MLKLVLSKNAEHLSAFQNTEEFEKLSLEGAMQVFLCRHL